VPSEFVAGEKAREKGREKLAFLVSHISPLAPHPVKLVVLVSHIFFRGTIGLHQVPAFCASASDAR